ncbi:MAG: rRNA maturation RNase YbeY [Candidatus Dormibacteria bacterium]|jgi:probable rRNA maturation factor
MRVTVHRSPTLDAASLALVRAGGLAGLLRGSGDLLGVPARAGLAVRLTDDAELRRLNRLHAGVDVATDVLAFPGDVRQWVGDVAISVERARVQNPAAPAEELRLLAVHGLLHCLGHDHDEPERAGAMTALTRRLLPGQDVPDLAAH